MMKRLLHACTAQPDLMAAHARAYLSLAGIECGQFAAAWQRRAVLMVLAAGAAAMALVLAGMAVMLWATLPPVPGAAPWALVVVPAVPALAALVLWLAARRHRGPAAFAGLQRQWAADRAWLTEASPP